MSTLYMLVWLTGEMTATQVPNYPQLQIPHGPGTAVFPGAPCIIEAKPIPVGAYAPHVVANAPPVVATKRDAVLQWNELVLQAIREDRSPPPLAARNLAIVHLAIFDAVNGVHSLHRPYLTEVRAVPWASAEAAAAGAAHRLLVTLYPKQQERFNRALAETLAPIPNPGREAGVQLGQFVADKYLEWRSRDGAQVEGKYVARHANGRWQPTLPGYRPPLLPNWGSVARFAIPKGSEQRVPGPRALTSAEYTAAYQEVKLVGAKNSRWRTPEQTQIALFWADDIGTSTPPGHWNNITRDVARQQGNSLVENARLFALLNISLADAAILCWVCKFDFEFWRPITGIRARDDGNPDTQPDPSWEPLLDTPPFPAYTSGHSSFSAAAATVLARFFGRDAIRFETTSEGLAGVKRSFASFSAAAAEAGQSRIYGGIHWNFDNADGLAAGRNIGEYVSRHYMQPRALDVVQVQAPWRSVPR